LQDTLNPYGWSFTMNKPRIHPLDPPYEAELAETLEKMMGGKGEPLKLFRTLARHPRLMKRFSALGGGILGRGLVAPEDREIVIHRTCARCGCEYEWGVHVAFFGRPLGLSGAQIAATVLGGPDDPCWSPRQALLIRFSDELHDTAALSDELWTALGEIWDEAQLIELLLTAGFYHLVSFAANGARIGLEDFAARFPAA
jgi:alkylhydroperoxidase family enzyme